MKKEEGRKKYGKHFLWNVAQREVMSQQLVGKNCRGLETKPLRSIIDN
ncbi:hypothetical protein [Okeania sp. KiyG1]|nr:hypothetical protein [Okeania sp. KiyG1]